MTSRAAQPEKLKPVVFEWDGENMATLARFTALANAQYVVGERYALIPYDQRSRVSHDHYFCCVRAAFQNWPEDYPLELPTEDALRYHALIQTGHYDQIIGSYETPAAADASARDLARRVEYAEFSVFENVAVLRFPKTQKKKVMGAALFQKSKQDVLDFLSAVLGLDVTTLQAEAKRMAA